MEHSVADGTAAVQITIYINANVYVHIVNAYSGISLKGSTELKTVCLPYHKEEPW